MISGCQSVNASWPVICLGSGPREAPRAGCGERDPLPPALNAGAAPGGPTAGPARRPRLPGAAERVFQARDVGGIGAECHAGAQVARQFDRWRQPLEHGRPALRIAAGGHLADRLLIKE